MNGTSGKPRPFRIDVPEADLADLKARLHATRWPIVDVDPNWRHGADPADLRAIHQHWRDRFDWRAQEERLNAIPQFLVTIDGLDIHYFHLRAEPGGDGTRPLLLLHGWPGSQIEFLDLLTPLAFPADDSGEPAFDVVVPALPGFGFGGKPAEPGWGQDRTAAAFNHLMTAVLGYDHYGIQAGDWGAIIGRRMAQNHAPSVAALHINMPYAPPPPGVAIPEANAAFQRSGMAYLALQQTKPDAIALGQSDSPMGLAAWILEKFASWSDTRGSLRDTYALDVLITNLMFYWLPNSAASAARIYVEATRDPIPPFHGARVEVPTGVAAFAAEPYRTPRAWVEAIYNVRHWADFDSGGHFAGLEQPAFLLREIRHFFGMALPPR
jgi:microsomal epoxide hydrolase